MLEEEKIKELLKKGKISLFDIDRDEDLIWAVADLYCLEKHLQLTLNFIVKKLEKEPKDEYYKKLYELTCNLLNGVRLERTKHLKRLVKLKEFGFWCCYKHLIGSMMQFAEVGGKDIYMKDENVKMDFETSAFCHDAVILLNQFSKLKKKKKKEVEHAKVKRAT
ncbi:MAG: hypothetical protein ACE5KD_00500 [Candidatus Bathyarchaeia archaeon]